MVGTIFLGLVMQSFCSLDIKRSLGIIPITGLIRGACVFAGMGFHLSGELRNSRGNTAPVSTCAG